MTDAWAGLVDFVGDLRAAGIRVAASRITDAAAALAAGAPEKYWPLRITLCSRRADLPLFDAVYAGWFEDEAAPEVETGPGTSSEGASAVAVEGARESTGGSGHEVLATRDIRDLSPDELAEVASLIALLRPAARRAVRREPARSGRIDIGRTVRVMLRSGGEPARIPRRRRFLRPRRLLLLIDISGSMRAYSDMLLRFAYAAVAAGPGRTEVFALGVRHTRLTLELAARDADTALRSAAGVETDWHGGTRLGPALEDFLRRWGRHRAVRAATVVICSDGSEYGDQTVLPRHVARLARIARRLIWVNPKQGRRNYRPVLPAHRESLRHVDECLPGHSFEALRDLAEVIAR